MLSERDILNASILVVDDQPANVQLLLRLLGDAGYLNVAATTDPLAACTLHREQRYDLILLDLQMPGLDGFQVMEGLKAIDADGYLSVIVLTAQPGHKLRALQAGAKDFISKPFDLVEVRTRIRNMLEVRLLYRQLDEHRQRLEQTVRERTAELQASEGRFRALTALASDWYWEQNGSGTVTHLSGPVEEMLGIGFGAFLGGDRAVVNTGWIEAERQALESKIAGRQPFLDFAFRRVDADGAQRHFRVSGEPMFGESGGYCGYRGIGVEVTAPNPPAAP